MNERVHKVLKLLNLPAEAAIRRGDEDSDGVGSGSAGPSTPPARLTELALQRLLSSLHSPRKQASLSLSS